MAGSVSTVRCLLLREQNRFCPNRYGSSGERATGVASQREVLHVARIVVVAQAGAHSSGTRLRGIPYGQPLLTVGQQKAASPNSCGWRNWPGTRLHGRVPQQPALDSLKGASGVTEKSAGVRSSTVQTSD